HFTAGIFEMGGASTQIVFEPLTRSFDDSAITPVKFPSDYLAAIDISGQTHKLYQHSYLGYGLDEARRQAYELLAAEAARNNRNSIDSPCFPDTFTENFVLGESMVRIYGNSSATLAADTDQQAALAHLNYERCSKLVRKILKKDHPCNTAPCSFNGVSQPRLSESLLKEQPFYVTSFFYDIASQFGLDTKFTPREFENLAKKVCQHDPSMFADAKGGEFLRSRPITCIDITYLVSILLDGVEMPPERTLSTAMTIDGFQNNWGLGVALSMLNQHRYCESSEV
ncbi:Guanosine-diphosphatase, partial [Spiromyces aspiralis]